MDVMVGVFVVEVVVEGAGEVRFARRVSWRPGAEGAPLVSGVEEVEVWVVRFVVEEGWVAGGAIRRDCVFDFGVSEVRWSGLCLCLRKCVP